MARPNTMECRRITRSMTKSAIHMQGGKSKSTSPYPNQIAGASDMFRNCKVVACSEKSKNRNIPLLPEEIIFSILVWLPADILYNVMRFVCRNWYNTICDPVFIKEHLSRSVFGLVIQHWLPPFTTFSIQLEKAEEEVVTRKLNCSFPHTYAACCDGLLLISDPTFTTFEYHVVNPITKQQVTLEPVPASLYGNRCALASAPSTGDYKVVHCYSSEIAILTIGVDKTWRYINTDHLPDDSRQFISCKPVSVTGFIYWFVPEKSCLFALDMDSEIIYLVQHPKDCQGRFLKKSESFLIFGTTDSKNVWDFWELMDSKLGKWRQLFKVDLKTQAQGLISVLSYEGYASIRPCAVVKNRDLVIFHCILRTPSIYIGYNVKTGKMFRYWKRKPYSDYVAHPHVNSLVVLKT